MFKYVKGKVIRNYCILFVILIFCTYRADASDKLSEINTSNISTKELRKSDEVWFSKKFIYSFMAVYKDKTFVITEAGKPKILSHANVKEKEQWLCDTAKEEFNDYVSSPKNGNKAFMILYNNQPIGALLYRLLNSNEKTIYPAQYFISPEFHKKGIGYYIIDKVLPKLPPEYKRYEILARHQNDAAFFLYRKLGFSIGDISLVQKYEYDPLRYMSFYKVLP